MEVVRLAAETGVVNFGKLSIDGTKVRASASKRKAMSYSRMLEEERRLEAEIGSLLDQARATDESEDERFGRQFRGDELPGELRRREDQLSAIRAAKVGLQAHARQVDEDAAGSLGKSVTRKADDPTSAVTANRRIRCRTISRTRKAGS